MRDRIPHALESARRRSGQLEQALRGLAAATCKRFGVSCRFERRALMTVFTPDAENHLYRFVEEAIVNAIKHGQASNILIVFDDNDDGILVRVIDDGVGIRSPEAITNGAGFRRMNERARLLGALFGLESFFNVRHATGTVITCRLPASLCVAREVSRA